MNVNRVAQKLMQKIESIDCWSNLPEYRSWSGSGWTIKTCCLPWCCPKIETVGRNLCPLSVKRSTLLAIEDIFICFVAVTVFYRKKFNFLPNFSLFLLFGICLLIRSKIMAPWIFTKYWYGQYVSIVRPEESFLNIL